MSKSVARCLSLCDAACFSYYLLSRCSALPSLTSAASLLRAGRRLRASPPGHPWSARSPLSRVLHPQAPPVTVRVGSPPPRCIPPRPTVRGCPTARLRRGLRRHLVPPRPPSPQRRRATPVDAPADRDVKQPLAALRREEGWEGCNCNAHNRTPLPPTGGAMHDTCPQRPAGCRWLGNRPLPHDAAPRHPPHPMRDG